MTGCEIIQAMCRVLTSEGNDRVEAATFLKNTKFMKAVYRSLVKRGSFDPHQPITDRRILKEDMAELTRGIARKAAKAAASAAERGEI